VEYFPEYFEALSVVLMARHRESGSIVGARGREYLLEEHVLGLEIAVDDQ
jgi:hypothetical protein